MQYNVIIASIVLIGVSRVRTESSTSSNETIKCYVCNSVHDPRCGDPFDPKTIELVDCQQFIPQGKNATVCRKNVQKVSLGSVTDLRIVRSCGFEPENNLSPEDLEDAKGKSSNPSKKQEDRCYNRAGTFEVMVTYCTCHGHQCNGVAKVYLDFFSVAVSMAIVSFFA